MHNNFLGRQADYVLEALTAPADYCLPSPRWNIGSVATQKCGGKGLYSPHCIEVWGGIRPPCPTACSTPGGAPAEIEFGTF